MYASFAKTRLRVEANDDQPIAVINQPCCRVTLHASRALDTSCVYHVVAHYRSRTRTRLERTGRVQACTTHPPSPSLAKIMIAIDPHRTRSGSLTSATLHGHSPALTTLVHDC